MIVTSSNLLRALALLVLATSSCGEGERHATAPDVPRPPATSAEAPTAPTRRTLTLLGTNDLHGHVEKTPILGGYFANVRAARRKDGGDVLLVDAGDMFQGTLESNLGEGVAVLHAYAALGYEAAAIGNHEFDYGPVGPAATPSAKGDDPRGALAALAAAASYPMLNANLLDKVTHARFSLPHAPASTVVMAAGARVGIVAVTSSDTLETTIAANVSDLQVAPLADTIAKEALRLREEEHADLVIAVAHAGGKCKSFTGDVAADGCEMNSEIFEVARRLPPKSVDAIVAGHTHQGLAHTVAGIPIIESYSYGRAFGRIDFTLERTGRGPVVVAAARVFPPEELCTTTPAGAGGRSCEATRYEGAPIVADARVAEAIAPDVDKAKSKRAEPLGVRLLETIHRDYDNESAEGNLFTDLLREAHPEATVTLVNGGGLRADLPAGPLTYGSLFEAFPFDNKVATVKLTVADLVRILEGHFARTGGILSLSGARVTVTCKNGRPSVELRGEGKRRLAPKDTITVLASDFMLTGGDGFWGSVTPPPITVADELMRDTLEKELRKRKELRESDAIDAKRPRLVFPGPRPVHCDPPR